MANESLRTIARQPRGPWLTLALLIGAIFVPAVAQPSPIGNRPAVAPEAPEASIRPEEMAPSAEAVADVEQSDGDRGSDGKAGPDLSPIADLAEWASPEAAGSSLQSLLMLAVLSLAPAILLMTTSFVRIAVVLGLLRQALGTQQLPSNQVVTSLALFMTLLIMTPVWTEVYDEAVRPYSDPEIAMPVELAWHKGIQPVRRFMIRQIDAAGNHDDVHLFYQYLPESSSAPQSYEDVPLQVLLPAFMLSELKIAFLIGFKVYLPFLILDLVVSAVTVSMGMMMLPPTMVSLPFKLMLFVLVDGWRLVVGMLLESFGTGMPLS